MWRLNCLVFCSGLLLLICQLELTRADFPCIVNCGNEGKKCHGTCMPKKDSACADACIQTTVACFHTCLDLGAGGGGSAGGAGGVPKVPSVPGPKSEIPPALSSGAAPEAPKAKEEPKEAPKQAPKEAPKEEPKPATGAGGHDAGKPDASRKLRLRN